MKKSTIPILVVVLLVQITTPAMASSPATIEIEPHPDSVSTDQILRFNAIVKDASGNQVMNQINWTSSTGVIDSDGFFTPGISGTAIITAESGGINTTTTIEVTNGLPYGISAKFNTTNVSVGETINLNATLIDRAGNPLPGDLTWRCQNGYIDHVNQTWKPDGLGQAVMRIIYMELEHQVTFNVIPGNATILEIPFGLTIQSGTTLHVIPIAKDSFGNEVDLSEVGTLSWSVENGTISTSGLYFAGAPGLWNITVNSSSGASGQGSIRVLPAQATGLSIGIENNVVRAGSIVSLAAIRADVLGNNGEVYLPLSNWTVPSGSLYVEDSTVKWIPSAIGNWTIGVEDQGFSATIQISVILGEISGIEILFSESNVKSGDLIVASISAFDSAGNNKAVIGAWTIDEELSPTNNAGWFELRPGPVGNYSISAIWFDNETQTVHETEYTVSVECGELARIILPQSGTRVASDDVLELSPIFEDEYGNTVDEVQVNWVVDGVDRTMEIRLAGGKWAPNSLGMHEIRAMAQGVFAITDIEVVAGTARYISTNHDDGIEVRSGETVEIEISTRDVHGNTALASEIDFDYEDPLGIIRESSKGDGYWKIEGGQAGIWNLRLQTGSATTDITVQVSSGEPVRLLAEIPKDSPEEGGTMIMRIHAVDQAGNRIEIPSDEITIKCTAGPVEHLAADTYEVTMEESGESQSCNVFWNDLVAQRFFDVDAVLFGGGLGSSNTALTLLSIIIFLFIAIMVVLIRRMKGESEDDYEWDDEFSDEEDVYSYDNETQSEPHQIKEDSNIMETEPEGEEQPSVESKEDLRAKLAAEARRTGVMQAAPGTEQGKTGWYIDSDGQLTSWLVNDTGEWTRMS